RSAVSQYVPRTVAAAKRPVVRKRPVALPQSRRTVRGATFELPASFRLQTSKLPPARRISTTACPLSTPRASTKIAGMPAPPETVTLPVPVVRSRLPRVTSTFELKAICPPVKGAPFTRTVPVAVPVGGPPGGTLGANGKEAAKLASVFPPAPVKLPPASSCAPNAASAVTLPFNGPFPLPFDPTGCQVLPSNEAI